MVVSSVSPERWLITLRQPAAVRHLDRLDRLGQRADLVELDQDALAARSSIARARRSVLVTSRSSPTSWTRSPSLRRKRAPAGPVILGQAVLEAHDRVAVDPVRPEADELAPASACAPSRPACRRLAVELGGGGVEGDGDLLARREACAFDRLHDHGDRRLVALQAGA